MSLKQVMIRMAANETAEVMIYEQIGESFWGDGIGAKEFREQIKALSGVKTINLRINSPGGSVIDGAAMLSTLDDWKKKSSGRRIDVDIDGLAASAASFVAMAGDDIRVASNALVMIHDPYGMVMGGAAEMRRTADLLDKVREQIIDAYQRHSKAGDEQLRQWMADETWFTGAEAVEAGLAHSVTQPASAAAMASHAQILAKLNYKHAPSVSDVVGRDDPQWEATRRRALVAAQLVRTP